MPEATTTHYALPYPTSAGNVAATPKDLEELAVAVEALLAAREQALFKTGDTKPSACATPQEGWLLCDGRAVSRAAYAALFAVIGVQAGAGDGSTTFNLPNGQNASAFGATSGQLPLLGSGGGLASVKLTSAQSGMVSHSHGPTEGNKYNDALPVNGQVAGNSVPFPPPKGIVAGTYIVGTQGVQGGARDAEEAHENMPPYVVGNWFIKT
jgi:microcystin-dependent protein